MTALSITLPSELASESKRVATKLGVSRSEFIRIALTHEIERTQKAMKLKSIVSSFDSMKKSKRYLKESRFIEHSFDKDAIKDDDDLWE